MKTEEADTKVPANEPTAKKGRHRKKLLFNSILQQMEFYFSDSNLSKDRFLSQLTQQTPFVDLNVFLQFNKIRKLTTNLEDIKKAVKKSELLLLSEDETSIGRKEPLKIKINVEECTIYVEGLKSDATHEWVHSVFNEFGKVVYSSIPKYRDNSVIKGFAFVEFDTPEEAEKTLNFFEEIGCKMPSNIEPDELCSIKTFEDNCEKADDSQCEKRKNGDTDENNQVNKKIKLDTGEENEETEAKKRKKLKKEHKKKNFIKELGLKILPKNEWKKMRNRYLELQRKKMKEFKKHLNKAKYGSSNFKEIVKDTKNEEAKVEQDENGIERKPKYDFEPGLILKVKLKEPVSDFKKPKADLKAINDVQYVEIPHIGCQEIFLRFSNSENAKKFEKHELIKEFSLLEGEEERLYWEKIEIQRSEKNKRTQKRQRGRDKLLKKAKHYKFDD